MNAASTGHRIPRPVTTLPKREPASADDVCNDPGVKPVQRDCSVRLVTGEPDAATAAGWAHAARVSMQDCGFAPAPKRRRVRLGWIGAVVWLLLAAAVVVMSIGPRESGGTRIEVIR